MYYATLCIIILKKIERKEDEKSHYLVGIVIDRIENARYTFRETLLHRMQNSQIKQAHFSSISNDNNFFHHFRRII